MDRDVFEKRVGVRKLGQTKIYVFGLLMKIEQVLLA